MSGDELDQLESIFGTLAGSGDDDAIDPRGETRRQAEADRQRLSHDAERIGTRCQTPTGFVREAWHTLEPTQPYIHGCHIHAICSHLEAIATGPFLARTAHSSANGSRARSSARRQPVRAGRGTGIWSATKKATAARTAGIKLGKTPDGSFVVGHVVKTQDEGNKVRTLIKATAEIDGGDVEISLPQVPGQAGKVQAKDMVAMLAGWKVQTVPGTGDKVTRAEPFSSQCEAGNVYLLQGDWNESYLDELCLFPGCSFKDQVDASSGALARLVVKREIETAITTVTGMY